MVHVTDVYTVDMVQVTVEHISEVHMKDVMDRMRTECMVRK